eukprot:CAMPEP_0182484798 /NCGR_PEP_ID=MMETSP1319-20130603/44079_1 /TAXON_ID=172717 /ORGANISM="Bolidomonas pacifica, Strain RCC208" /LENGTH=231 /DNA_ID=CAMNT_0024686723 /DNA_START=41 /DNA_END=733 /DNA_ORIENTATION=+
MASPIDAGEQILQELLQYTGQRNAGGTDAAAQMEQYQAYQNGVVSLVQRMADHADALSQFIALTGDMTQVAAAADVALKLDSTLDFRAAVRNDLTLFKRLHSSIRTSVADQQAVEDQMGALMNFLNNPGMKRGVYVTKVQSAMQGDAQVVTAVTQSWETFEQARRGNNNWTNDQQSTAAFRPVLFLTCVLANIIEQSGTGETMRQALGRCRIPWRRFCQAIHAADTIPCAQ